MTQTDHEHEYDAQQLCTICGNAKLLEGRWPEATWFQLRLEESRRALRKEWITR